MSVKPRFVLDTNVLVSALLMEASLPMAALDHTSKRGQLLFSLDTLRELRDVLARPKFDRFLPREEREEFLRGLIREGSEIQIDHVIRACRDPKDDKFLELAVCGQASCIITGDADLLALHPFRGTEILTPARFLELFERGGR